MFSNTAIKSALIALAAVAVASRIPQVKSIVFGS